jgi:hypothetical protein
MSAEGVLNRANKDARRSDGNGHHTASVWADQAAEGEDRASLIGRILADTELHGLDPAKNTHLWWCASARAIVDAGFVFEKDGNADESESHYSVVLGDPPTLEDAERFVTLFTKERRPAQ